jgi:hypothetical protein
MYIVDYPFIKVGEADSRPAFFIKLTHAGTGYFQDTLGIIDTGASACCVPISYASALALDPYSGVERTVRTAKDTSKAYEHCCGITVWNTHEFFKNNKVVAHEVTNIPILFMPDLKDVLIGVSFMNEKILTIDYHRKVFSVHDP